MENRATASLAVMTTFGLLAATASAQCIPYQIQWFGCDDGHDNPPCENLQLDGRPYCNDRPCPSPPDQCWNTDITAFAHSGGGVDWNSDGSGTISLFHGQDYIVRGRTYLYSDADRTIHIIATGDTFRFYFNGVGSQCVAEHDIHLHAGRNSFFWVASNQNQSSHVDIRIPTIAGVRACHEAVRCPADINGDGFVDFFDYLAFVVAFESGDAGADVNGDGFLDFFDYDEYLRLFELGC